MGGGDARSEARQGVFSFSLLRPKMRLLILGSAAFTTVHRPGVLALDTGNSSDAPRCAGEFALGAVNGSRDDIVATYQRADPREIQSYNFQYYSIHNIQVSQRARAALYKSLPVPLPSGCIATPNA